MEKRVFLAIFLSLVVLVVWQKYFAPAPPKPATAIGGAATTSAGVAGQPAAPAASSSASAASAPLVTPLVGDTAAREIVVDTNTVRAVFSTKGATLQSWKLKAYPDEGQPLEFIPADVPDTLDRAFAISTNDPTLSKVLATALFRPSTDSLSLGTAPGELRFEYRDQSGLNAHKTFYFQPEGKPYVLKVDASVDVAGASRPVTIASGPALGIGFQPDNSRFIPARAVQYRNGKLERLTASALQKQSRYEGEFKFFGVQNQYFLNSALPGSNQFTIDYSPVTLPVTGDPEGRSRTYVSYRLSQPGPASLQFFLGPMDFDILHDVDPRLELVRAIDFGMFSAIVVPLLRALKWLNGYLHNYGWSIVALTVLINLVIFPLRHRSMVSMRKMQAVQPEIKAIQERYAKYKVTDPERQKMNTEVMALYKAKGVNPAGGCLPMLLTMPILFAFYALLSAAIELRGAPFAGWIHDLSRHDPYYITPILMGLSMLWQMRLSPSTADPIQQKMFMLMPLVFTFSFLKAPAGLVIYWFSSNLLAIGQQYFTNRMIGAPPPRLAARAAPSASTVVRKS